MNRNPYMAEMRRRQIEERIGRAIVYVGFAAFLMWLLFRSF